MKKEKGQKKSSVQSAEPNKTYEYSNRTKIK